MKPIITHSRCGKLRTIESVDSEQGIFKMFGESNFIRRGDNMFAFEGGPMLQIGEEFYGLGTVSSLEYSENLVKGNNNTCVYVSIDMNKKTIHEQW